MKRIAIFCDGTWNHSDVEHATNVVKLSQAVRLKASDGISQQLIYVPGVGTGRHTGKLSRWINKLFGGAFGLGLEAKILEAYRHLIFNYETGDQIYIFGFSRGAYTARSFAGLLRSSSIPPRAQIDVVPDALDRYRSREKSTHPNSEESFIFRHRINAQLVTCDEERDWRLAQGLDPGHMINIAYVGVWDTVGALGVPQYFAGLARIFNQKYEFHDTDLSRSVCAARHAVSIDERRRTFPPALWHNLDRLNGDKTGAQRAYQQVWFPGIHGSVGGGGDIVELSNDTLIWVAEGAENVGLDFEGQALATYRDQRDHLGPLVNQTNPKSGILAKLIARFKKDRDGPGHADEVSRAARLRWQQADPAYRPKTLDQVADDLAD